MLWITVGLFVVGTACGGFVRLVVFVGVLVAGAAIAAVATASHGLGATLLAVLVTVIALQVGYVAGLVLRAASRYLTTGAGTRAAGKRPVNAPLKRR